MARAQVRSRRAVKEGRFKAIYKIELADERVVFGADVKRTGGFFVLRTILPNGMLVTNRYRESTVMSCVTAVAGGGKNGESQHKICLGALCALLIAEEPESYLTQDFIAYCNQMQSAMQIGSIWRAAVVGMTEACLSRSEGRLVPRGVVETVAQFDVFDDERRDDLLLSIASNVAVQRDIRKEAMDALANEERVAWLATNLALEVNGCYCRKETRAQRTWYVTCVVDLLGRIFDPALLEAAMMKLFAHYEQDGHNERMVPRGGWMDTIHFFRLRIQALQSDAPDVEDSSDAPAYDPATNAKPEADAASDGDTASEDAVPPDGGQR